MLNTTASTYTGPVITMETIRAAAKAMADTWAEPEPAYRFVYVHPSLAAAYRRLYARERGSPIRRHARAGSVRGRKRALYRSWRANPLPRGPNGNPIAIGLGSEIVERTLLPFSALGNPPL